MESSPRKYTIYDLVSAIMLGLTCLAVLFYLGIAATNPAGQQTAKAEPTIFTLPSETPTIDGPTPNSTHTITPTPTDTTTPEPTRTDRPTQTTTPTDTPTATPTLTPSNTPTASFTPSQTATPVDTATATDSPFDYVLVNTKHRANYANNAGCDWAGIAGTVKDISGSHQLGIVVHVSGNGVDQRVTSGSGNTYGTSGWEQSVYSNIGTTFRDAGVPGNTYDVQLETSGGSILSDVESVTFKDDCDKNLIVMDFEQIQ